jgi:hypothetical protein
VFKSGVLSGASVLNRSGRSGFARKSAPKATASASLFCIVLFALALSYPPFAMSTPL